MSPCRRLPETERHPDEHCHRRPTTLENTGATNPTSQPHPPKSQPVKWRGPLCISPHTMTAWKMVSAGRQAGPRPQETVSGSSPGRLARVGGEVFYFQIGTNQRRRGLPLHKVVGLHLSEKGKKPENL